jgi:hypothetical protein
MPGDVVTGHIWQIEIHEQNRGHELDSQSKSSRSGVRDARIAVPQRLHQCGKRIGSGHVVIDYQYARHIALGAFALRPRWFQRLHSHDSGLSESSQHAGADWPCKGLDPVFGFVARDAISLLNLTRKARMPACNQVQVGGASLPKFARISGLNCFQLASAKFPSIYPSGVLPVPRSRRSAAIVRLG